MHLTNGNNTILLKMDQNTLIGDEFYGISSTGCNMNIEYNHK